MSAPVPSLDDSLIADSIESLLASVRRGESPNVEGACQRHPERAGEIRALWATAMLAENLFTDDDLFEPPAKANPTTSMPRVLGDFEILEELGRGGMGVVYKARQVSLDRVVALKMILRGDLATSDDQARFRQEAESAARIDHPHIVPIYESGQIDGRLYFSMKYIEGTTLARKLGEGPMKARDAARTLKVVAEAMAEAHRRGVLHRDLKPANILIDLCEQPHVTDFGLAKRTEGIGSLTQSGLLVGTPSYMAPEQAGQERGAISAATDVYSLGAILYQMLTGRPPFQAATPFDTVMMLLEQEPVPPRMLNRTADVDLEMICLRCLQKHPDLRYPDAAVLAEELDRYLRNEPISVRSGTWMQAVSRVLRETHHAPLLENWGLLWMWNGVVLLAICLWTNLMQFQGYTQVSPYLALWTFGLGTWAAIFWQLRRRAGPIRFVERQVAHVWAASVICTSLLYFIEILLDLPVLELSPVLALVGGTVFLVKASILTGSFYVQAIANFLTAFVMAIFPSVGLTIFGVVACLSFFIPGLKYYRQRIRLAAQE